MGMSIRAYAQHRGVSHEAVRKAIAAGRIHKEADGSIDPAKADAQWQQHTRPAPLPSAKTRGNPGGNAGGNGPNIGCTAHPFCG